VTATRQVGSCKVTHGTWSAASVTAGAIFLSKNTTYPPTAFTTTTASNTTLTTSGDYTTAPAVLAGDVISGTGIIGGTYVVSVESATSLTMSEAATDATAGARTFTRPVEVPGHMITAKVTNSVSAVTQTGARIRTTISPGHIDITTVSGDAGWFSVYYV
jgi:hypothetical protein